MLNPNWQTDPKKSTREGFGDAIVNLAKCNSLIQVLTADLKDSLKLEKLSQELPQQFLEVGISEQNMIGIASGLAANGFIPFATSYSVFSPGRNWDQLRVSVCYSNLNVKLVSSHAGLSVGPDGAVHQALEDITLTRVLPNLTVISPCDYHQAIAATTALSNHLGPAYLRLSRANNHQLTTSQSDFKIGTNQLFHSGNKITIVSTGFLVVEALKVATELDADVINVHTIKPLDINSIISSLNKTHHLVVLEEHQLSGGLGSAVFESLIQSGYPIPSTLHLGVNDQFGQSGTESELLNHYGLTSRHVVNAVKSKGW